MKKDIHPAYHPVVYHDTSAGIEFTSRSTQKSAEVRKIDGVDHYVIRVEISAASHPFYTGKQKFVDTAGRIEKFQKKFAGKYGTAVAEAKAVEAKAATQKAVETRAAEAKAAQAKAIAVKAAAAKAAAAKTAAAPPKQ